MSLAQLKNQAADLQPVEQRELIAFLISRQTEQNEDFKRTLAQKIDDIFVRTLVNDPADALTPKRLELLSYGAQCMLRIADFTKLG